MRQQCPGLIALTKMNHFAFTKCLKAYLPFCPNGRVSIKSSPIGHTHKIYTENCLGLTIAWARTRGGQFAMNLIFGMTASNFQMYIKFGLRIIVNCLNKHTSTKI